jgi:uncharacterized UBP type Zn finger protein
MTCTHFDALGPVARQTRGCEECEANGDSWVHLRACLVCGKVCCCDTSKNQHMTKHFQETGHPVMRSVEPHEHWAWCFVDQAVTELQ